MSVFKLDPRLAGDTFTVLHWPLCRMLLMNDARYPWLILVPERAEVSEVFELSPDDLTQLHRESDGLARFMKQWFDADKMNVAALGNVVSQLHVHHVARYRHDACWPAPVWGRGTAEPYTAEAAAALIESLRTALPALP